MIDDVPPVIDEPKPKSKKNGKGNGKLKVVTDGPPLFDGDERPAWEAGLIRNKWGITKSIANISLILTEHDAWKGVLAHDQFAERTYASRPPPCTESTQQWRDIDTTRVREWLAKEYKIEAGADLVDSVIESVAAKNPHHPVRDYLDSLRWDGEPRVGTMLERYFGAKCNQYHSEISKMWMISAVARVMIPGCQADYMLVLIGPQGIRKSTAIRVLAKGWGADTIITIGDPDAMRALKGVWLYEIAELAAIKGARDIERVKGFVTSRVDHLRMSYGRRHIDSPRQCVFAGTTNEDIPLNDSSGNRRQWVVDCGKIDVDALKADVDQLWAETYALYQSGVAWYPTTVEVAKLCHEEQQAHAQVDPWVPEVERWLHRSVGYVTIRRGLDDYDRLELADGITTTDALLGAIGSSKERIDHYAQIRMGRVLKDCGMVAKRPRTGQLESRSRRYYPGPVWSSQQTPPIGPDQVALFGPDYIGGPVGPIDST